MQSRQNRHIPVLLKEAIEVLDPKEGEFFIDGTFGLGGHSEAIAERIGKSGKLLGVDWDRQNIERGRQLTEKWPVQTILKHGNFAELKEIIRESKLGRADAIILDLGFSSEQLAAGRGFSFLKDEILDMRYAADTAIETASQAASRPESGLAGRENERNERVERRMTAAEIINSFSKERLAEIIWRYGEERNARKIAEAVVAARRKKRILTSGALAEIVKNVLPPNYEKGRIHPATKTFQALRIYVNGELENLEKILSDLEEILKPKGRAAVISFHSLEDRLVKNYFNKLKSKGAAEILTKKPITASRSEIAANPRARSAKLRVLCLTNH